MSVQEVVQILETSDRHNSRLNQYTSLNAKYDVTRFSVERGQFVAVPSACGCCGADWRTPTCEKCMEGISDELRVTLWRSTSIEPKVSFKLWECVKKLPAHYQPMFDTGQSRARNATGSQEKEGSRPLRYAVLPLSSNSTLHQTRRWDGAQATLADNVLLRLGVDPTGGPTGVLDPSDVPLIVGDFASKVRKAEMHIVEQQVTSRAHTQAHILNQLRVCAAMNARLFQHFETATGGQSVGPLNIAKVKKDYERTQERLYGAVEGYERLPAVVALEAGGAHCAWSASHIPTPSSEMPKETKLCASTWDNSLERELNEEKRDALLKVEQDVRSLSEYHQRFGQQVYAADDQINVVDELVVGSAEDSAKAAIEVAKTAKSTARWWPMHGSGAGALIGGVVGIVFGPPGVVAGAALGGAGGLMAGSKLKRRHNKKMDGVITLCDRARSQSSQSANAE
eukprot:GHVN01067030.1.p1 GENE.GHVN01067030.1~~GHVN01067030.1.p1  ORF type:complete len:453 (+),score=52.65 GHVN01067030.1:4379-5737(+)